MQRELLPTGQGVIRDDRGCHVEAAQDEYYFNMFDDDDVDCSQRTPPRRAPVKKLLHKVPIGLCPILPAAAPLLTSTPVTPNNSMSPSPLDSPPHGSPVLAPVKNISEARNKQGGPMMKIMPLLPPTPPDQLATTDVTSKGTAGSGPGNGNILTPPETPTFAARELPTVHDVRPMSSCFLPCGPAVIPTSSSQESENQHGRPAVTSLEPKDIPQIKLSSSPR